MTEPEPPMPDPALLALIAGVFFLAGGVKGVIGLGLPTVSLALLTATVGLKTAIALTIVPAFATNVWQGLAGGAFRRIAARIWPVLLPAAAGIFVGTALLAAGNPRLFSALFGGLLALYAGYSLLMPQIPAPGRHERWLSPVIGGIGGVVCGFTGSFVVPGALYLQALRLPRDELVQALGIAFTVVVAVLAVALGRHALLTAELGLLSATGLVPAFLGMWAGSRVRRRLSEARFRRAFFVGLLGVGVFIVVRAAGSAG